MIFQNIKIKTFFCLFLASSLLFFFLFLSCHCQQIIRYKEQLMSVIKTCIMYKADSAGGNDLNDGRTVSVIVFFIQGVYIWHGCGFLWNRSKQMITAGRRCFSLLHNHPSRWYMDAHRDTCPPGRRNHKHNIVQYNRGIPGMYMMTSVVVVCFFSGCPPGTSSVKHTAQACVINCRLQTVRRNDQETISRKKNAIK